jgi:hypothetical protein
MEETMRASGWGSIGRGPAPTAIAADITSSPAHGDLGPYGDNSKLRRG